MNKLQLNPNSEVSIHGQAADLEFTLEYQSNEREEWMLYVINVISNISTALLLTKEQAAATMALLVAGDFTNEQLNERLYDIASPAWKDVDNKLRLIP